MEGLCRPSRRLFLLPEPAPWPLLASFSEPEADACPRVGAMREVYASCYCNGWRTCHAAAYTAGCFHPITPSHLISPRVPAPIMPFKSLHHFGSLKTWER